MQQVRIAGQECKFYGKYEKYDRKKDFEKLMIEENEGEWKVHSVAVDGQKIKIIRKDEYKYIPWSTKSRRAFQSRKYKEIIRMSHMMKAWKE